MCNLSTPKIAQGFTLIELMVSIAIVGVLAAFAIPAYINYMNKAHFTEVVQAATAYKAAVGTCAMVVGNEKECSQGQNGIPIPQPSKIMSAFTIKEGVIYIKGKGTPPLDADYSLQASLDGGGVNWIIGGSCKSAGLC